MPIVFINNVGTAGLIQDQPPHTLPLEAWTGANNVSFIDGVVKRTKGIAATLATPSIDAYFMLNWITATTTYWIYGNASKLYRTDGTTDAEVTRGISTVVSNYSGGSWPKWTGGVFNGIPVINIDSFVDPPQSWNFAISEFQDLPNWPAGWYARVVRPFRNYLIALDLVRSAVSYPWEIRWSASAPAGAVPTTWTAAPGNDAGSSNALAETQDYIVDCARLGSFNVIYKENSVWAQEWIGGNQVFAHRQRFSEFGLLTQNCAKQFFNKHFVVAGDDVVLHDLVNAESIIDGKNRRALFNSIDRNYFSHVLVALDVRNTEALIAIPEAGGSGELTQLFIWNWRHNTWTQRDITSAGFITSGVVPLVSGTTFDGSAGTVFDSDAGAFDLRASIAGRDLVASRIGTTKTFGLMNSGNQIYGSDFTSYVERTGLPISGVARDGSPVINPESVKFVRGVVPLISAEAGVIINVRVGVQQHIDGPIAWTGTMPFDPSTDTKVDCTVSGKLISVRFESTSAGQWQLRGYGLDLNVISRF